MPQGDFANYSADRVVGVFSGILLNRGAADGTFLRMRPKSDGFTSRVGSEGLVSHSKSNDPRWEVSVILEDSSITNSLLSALHNADLSAPNGAGVGAFSVTDFNGTLVFTSEIARIMRCTDVEFARETGTREWLLEAIVRPGQGFVGSR